jgi:hypothetical protein
MPCQVQELPAEINREKVPLRLRACRSRLGLQ